MKKLLVVVGLLLLAAAVSASAQVGEQARYFVDSFLKQHQPAGG